MGSFDVATLFVCESLGREVKDAVGPWTRGRSHSQWHASQQSVLEKDKRKHKWARTWSESTRMTCIPASINAFGQPGENAGPGYQEWLVIMRTRQKNRLVRYVCWVWIPPLVAWKRTATRLCHGQFEASTQLVMSSSKGATNRKRQREKMRGRCVDRKNRQRKRVTERLLARRDYFENMRAHSRNMSLKTMRGFSG